MILGYFSSNSAWNSSRGVAKLSAQSMIVKVICSSVSVTTGSVVAVSVVVSSAVVSLPTLTPHADNETNIVSAIRDAIIFLFIILLLLKINFILCHKNYPYEP